MREANKETNEGSHEKPNNISLKSIGVQLEISQGRINVFSRGTPGADRNADFVEDALKDKEVKQYVIDIFNMPNGHLQLDKTFASIASIAQMSHRGRVINIREFDTSSVSMLKGIARGVSSENQSPSTHKRREERSRRNRQFVETETTQERFNLKNLFPSGKTPVEWVAFNLENKTERVSRKAIQNVPGFQNYPLPGLVIQTNGSDLKLTLESNNYGNKELFLFSKDKQPVNLLKFPLNSPKNRGFIGYLDDGGHCIELAEFLVNNGAIAIRLDE